ncbi:uncharacterized protein LOC127104155 [Lathyrus oleraceus]|uniref:uncharacterized protein LOC127104155 n=1 Tax=Pisum sativum TaxID=3888 RepID=UPI0021D1593C|nr:uncharacterized protein LOC127104155 [Pisum sativum]
MQQAQGSNQLPIQTVVNPKGPNVSAISLRSAKSFEPAPTPEKINKIVKPIPKPNSDVVVEAEKEKEYVPPIPFPHRVAKNKKLDEEDKDNEVFDIFKKVAVNIPFLDVIKKIPKYAKFLKDLCIHKMRLKGNERVNMGINVYAFIHPNISAITQDMPQKCKDPETFVIPCTIGDNKFENCMVDLEASINVMPTPVYNNLDLDPLQNTCLTIQLANKSNARPAGVAEDVLVQINDLIFPANFYILEMEGDTKSRRAPIILGRPYMKIAKIKIDVVDGTTSMEFGDIIVKFNIYDAMKHPMEEYSVFHIELLSEFVDDTYSDLFSADFSSLSDFDYTDYCDSCTDTNICSACAEIEDALHVDIFPTDEVVIEAVYAAEALDILVLYPKICPSFLISSFNP